MSTGRQNLANQGRGPDALWFDEEGDIHDFKGWARSHNYIPETFDIQPNQVNYTYGNIVTFEIDKRGDAMGRNELFVTRGAVTNSDVGSTNSFVDFEGYASIQVVRYYYSNKLFFEQWGEDLMVKWYQRSPQERTSIAAGQYGGRTEIERQLNTAAQYTWSMDLEIPWEEMSKHIPMIALPNKIRVDVQFNPLSKCLKTSSTVLTPLVAISNMFLRVHMHHFEHQKRGKRFSETNTGNGVATKMLTREYHQRQLLSPLTKTQTYRIRNIKNSVTEFTFFVRAQSDVDTQATLNPWNFIRPSRFWFQDNGQQVTNKIEIKDSTDGSTAAAWGLNFYRQRIHPVGVVAPNLPTMTFLEEELTEASENDAHGSRYFAKYNNPELVVEFDTAIQPTVNCYIDMYADVHNLVIYQKGDIRRYLL